jgi:hypothetical protein
MAAEDSTTAKEAPVSKAHQGAETIGVPFDSGAFDRTDALYRAIERGDHDHELDGIEKAANARKRARSHPRMEVWDGPAPTGWTDGIAAGYYDCQGREGMQMLLGAVRNRRSTLEVAAMKAAGATSTVAAGDRVRVKADAPLRPTYVLGKTGVVAKVNQTTATVVFDPGQYLGRFEPKRPGQGTRCPLGALEKIDAPAPEAPAPASAPARADGLDLSPAHARLLAELLELEIQTGPDAQVDDLTALQRRLQAHAGREAR